MTDSAQTDNSTGAASSPAAMTVALIGNPNSGKTTVFNAMTGARQHVGNYPGVTVEKKEGSARHGGVKLNIVDLPGTYSLTAYTIEEIVARNFLLDEAPDVVIDIVDASNLERNLYLATQLLELGVPLVLAFNMSDVAAGRGLRIDRGRLSELLGVPIVETVGHKAKGVDDLLAAAVAVARDDGAVQRQRHPHYGGEIEPHVRELTDRLTSACGLKLHRRWSALKLLENDAETIRRLRAGCGEGIEPVLADAARLRGHLEGVCGDEPEVILADRRYGFISGACTEATTQSVEARHNRSDMIDAVLTHRWGGLPIFAALMYVVFLGTFAVGNPLVDLLDGWISGDLGGWISRFWPRGSDSLLRSLLVDGVIGGVGAVLAFTPLIGLLFLAIAVLEDTGYMARAAFIMDGLMHKIGLHGKSFVPMLIGFGCSVPAIMATRTLESRRGRLTTMLIVPLMSCGARLPIYMLIIPAFFPRVWHTPVLWGLYVVGIVLAIFCAKLLRSTVLKGEIAPLVMELPPYRLPTVRGLAIHTWIRTWQYVRKAGTVIFALSVLLWAANTFPRKTQADGEFARQAAQGRAVFLRRAAEAGPFADRLAEAGLSNPKLLAGALAAELDRAETQRKYWPDEPGFAQAERDADAAIRTLVADAGASQGQALAGFLAMRDEILAARRDFADSVAEEGLEPGSRAYAAARRWHEEELARIRQREPKLYAAAEHFLTHLLAPFQEDLRDISGRRRAEELAYSVSGRIGRGAAPALRPMGLDWRFGVAMVGAMGAKEVFVSQMGIIYSLGEDVGEAPEGLRAKLRRDYSPLQALSILLFCLISAPCIATVAVTWRESGHVKWALLQLLGLTALAYVVCTLTYQIGRLVT